MGAIKIKAKPPSRVAVDTYILIALADHNQEAWKAISAIQNRFESVKFLILPTVLTELFAHTKSPDQELRRLALRVFSELKTPPWRNFDVTDFVGVGYGIVEELAKSVIRKRLWPDHERNDALILGEASLQQSSFFLTEDGHFLNMNVSGVRAAVEDFDLNAPAVLSCVMAVQLVNSSK